MLRPMNRKQGTLIAVIAVSIFMTSSYAADNAGSITGVVKDKSGKPVAGAFVRAENTDRGLSVTVISQQGGRFNAPNLFPGRYTVRAWAVGLRSEDTAVDLAGSRSPALDLKLTAPIDVKEDVSMADYSVFLPEAEGKPVIMAWCTGCHIYGYQEIVLQRKSREEWMKVFARMKDRPASKYPAVFESHNNVSLRFPSKEVEDIALDYLTKYFGPDSPRADLSKLPALNYRAEGKAMKAVITEKAITPKSFPHDFVVGKDGIAWVEEREHDALGRFDPQTGIYTQVAVPKGSSGINDPSPKVVDPQGRVWFGDGHNERMVRYDPKTQTFDMFPFPESTRKGRRVSCHDAVVAADGTVWGTSIGSDEAWSLNPNTKKYTLYPTPNFDQTGVQSEPYGMAIGGDGAVWYIERQGNKVARVDPKTGETKEFEVPTKYAFPKRMDTDWDGNMWFGEFGAGKLAMVDYKTGKITEYEPPTKDAGPYRATVDRGRKLIWVAEMKASKIASFDPRTKAFVEYPLPDPLASIRWIEIDPIHNNRIWYSGFHTQKISYIEIVQ